MAYFPFYIDLSDKKCLIIGGGNVAYRKVKVLLEHNAHITLISVDVCDKIKAYGDRINILHKSFELSDLDGYFYVISATDDVALNKEVSEYCLKNNILINVVDDEKKCNFIFPAVLQRGDIVVGVSTSGSSPTMAGHIRDMIDKIMPSYYDSLVGRLGNIRGRVKNSVSTEKKRTIALKKLTNYGLENKGVISDDIVSEVINEVNEEN